MVKSTRIRLEVLQRRHRLSGLDVLADIDLRDAGDAGERRQIAFCAIVAVDLFGTPCGQGELVCAVCRSAEVATLRVKSICGAVERVLVDRHGRLRRGEAGALDGVVDLHEHRPSATLSFPLKLTALTTPPTWPATSTPCAAASVPTASMPGVHFCGLTSTVETVMVGTGKCAKNCAIILSRKKLNQISPPQTASTSRRTKVPTMNRSTEPFRDAGT